MSALLQLLSKIDQLPSTRLNFRIAGRADLLRFGISGEGVGLLLYGVRKVESRRFRSQFSEKVHDANGGHPLHLGVIATVHRDGVQSETTNVGLDS